MADKEGTLQIIFIVLAITSLITLILGLNWFITNLFPFNLKNILWPFIQTVLSALSLYLCLNQLGLEKNTKEFLEMLKEEI